jgi:hypothetical protein
MRPSWPWVVNGSRATSVITPSAGNSFLTARTASWAIPPGFHDSRASSDFLSAGTTGKSAMAGIDNRARMAHSRSSSSTDSRSMPGIEAMGCLCFAPSTTNIG